MYKRQAEDNLKMIHVRKLKDLKGKEAWEKLMIARRFSKIGSATDLRQADLREVVRRSLGYKMCIRDRR